VFWVGDKIASRPKHRRVSPSAHLFRDAGDGDNGQLALLGSVAPEDAIGAWSVVLGVRLEDLTPRIEGMLQRVVLGR
jgi:hypothetical protein